MKNLTLLSICLFLMVHALSGQDLEWVKTMGGTGDDMGNYITTDANGNIYTLGTYEGSVDFDPDPVNTEIAVSGNGGTSTDIFIQKLDSSANFIWVKHLTTTNRFFGNGLGVDSMQNVYVAGNFKGQADFDPDTGTFIMNSPGQFEQDMFFLKLDPNGSFVWAKEIDCLNNCYETNVNCMVVEPNGDMIIGGVFSGDSVDFDPGPGNVSQFPGIRGGTFFMKLNTNGELVWAKEIEGDDIDPVYGITTDRNGNILMAGKIEGEADFDPGPGTFLLEGDGEFAIFHAKYTSGGDLVWANTISSGYPQVGHVVSSDDKGNMYAMGQICGSGFASLDFDPGPGSTSISPRDCNPYIVKYDSAGNFVWVDTLTDFASAGRAGSYANGGGPRLTRPILTASPSGQVYIASYFTQTAGYGRQDNIFNSNGEEDIFVIALDQDGALLWSKGIGAGGDDRAFAITVTPEDDLLVTGLFEGTVNFNPGASSPVNLSTNGERDAFIMKLSSSGPNSISPALEAGIQVYPNPSTGVLRYTAPNSVLISRVKVYNPLGKVIFSAEGIQAKGELDVSHLAKGMYQLVFESEKGLQYSSSILLR